MTLEGLSLGRPLLLWLLALLPVMVALFVGAQRRKGRVIQDYGGPHLGRSGFLASPWRQGLKALLRWLALAAIVMTLAQPQWGVAVKQAQEEGVDLLIALDISASMGAPDVAPSRLAAAKGELRRLLDRLPRGRVGLLLFARNTLLRFPFTDDFEVAAQLMDHHDPGFALRPGTALGEAITAALGAFDWESPRAKILLLVTDGEDFSGGLLDALAEARGRGLPIYTLAVGTEAGAPVPLYDAKGNIIGERKDAAGLPVRTALNAPLLRQVAAVTGGRYYQLRGPASVAPDLAKNLLETPAPLVPGAEAPLPIDRSPLFALIALSLLVVELLTPERKPRPALGGLVPSHGVALLMGALLLPLTACTEAAFEHNATANALFAKGDYTAALEGYRKAQLERPDLPELNYNVGNTLYRLGAYERALTELRHLLGAQDSRLQTQGYYNLGDTLFRLGRLEEAQEAFKETLRRDPTDRDAKFNLEYIDRLLKPAQPPADQGAPEGEPPPGEGGQPQEGPGQQGQPPQGEQPRPGSAESLREALGAVGEEMTIDEVLRVLEALRRAEEGRRLLPTLPQEKSSGLPDW